MFGGAHLDAWHQCRARRLAGTACRIYYRGDRDYHCNKQPGRLRRTGFFDSRVCAMVPSEGTLALVSTLTALKIA
jgi:hypothetical protein